jgi:PAS domain S-box-containing protein
MDASNYEEMQEEIPDVKPQESQRSLISTTRIRSDALSDTPTKARSRTPLLKRLRYWLRVSTFSPEWLTKPLNYPLIGYGVAILLPVLVVMLTYLFTRIFPTFAFPGALETLEILVVALLWGIGPGLLSTLVGIVLLNFFILPPPFTWSFMTVQDGVETLLFLAIGITISVTASRIEHERTNAVKAHFALVAMTQLIGHVPELEETDETRSETNKREGLSAKEVAHQLAELTCSVLRCQRLSITMIEPETEIMRPLDVIGLSPEQEKQWWEEQLKHESRLSDGPDQSLVQRLMANEIVLIDMTQPPWNSFPNTYGIRTMLVAPMGTRNHLIGFLTMDHGGAEHHYSSEELRITGAVAKLVSTVIEHDQLLHQQEEFRSKEMVLRITNEQMANLIALAHDAIIVRDPSSVIISWNQGAESLYGWTAQQAIGQLSHVLLQARFPDSREVTDNSLELFGQWEGHLVHTRSDGAQVTVESRQVLIRDTSGQPTTVLEINRDITERERLQREQVEAHARELALHETKKRMDEFLGIASHELRTPLTTIKGNIQLAKIRLNHSIRDILQNTLVDLQLMLDRAERQVNVQNRLIRDLLDISSIQADKLELQLEQCDLITIACDAVDDMQSTVPARVFHTQLPSEETAPVFADAERIGQVITNYLTNALKYSPTDCPIEVRLGKEGGMARVSVSDQGPGLSPSEQAQVWEKFYQAKGIKRQQGFGVGLGLGLHICKEIIEQHQGQVGIESTVGEGSTFWFTLPLTEDEPVSPSEN